MFAFVCLLLFSATNENERENRQLFYVLFSFLAKILSLNSKDTAATTDVVQLMIRIIIVLLLLLTRTIIPINFYAAFFNSTVKDFSLCSLIRLEMRLS